MTRKQLLARKRCLERTFMDMRLRDADRAIEEIKRIDTKLERVVPSRAKRSDRRRKR